MTVWWACVYMKEREGDSVVGMCLYEGKGR